MLAGVFCALCCILTVTSAIKQIKQRVDTVIEDEITDKMSEDLFQSLEKKFQADLHKSVDTVLLKIKHMLNNGTSFVHDKMLLLQDEIGELKKNGATEADKCLKERQNETTELAQKALHQMVLCGYALIGHDPATALAKVLEMKLKIKDGLEPVKRSKQELKDLLKTCGHNHDSLKKVIKCVISKSPVVKASMMDITNRMIEGVVELTKLMAHGAMHEACLIEVVRSTEDEAFVILEKVKTCSLGNKAVNDNAKEFIKANNATELDVDNRINKGGKVINEIKNESEKPSIQSKRILVIDDKADMFEKKRKERLLKYHSRSPLDINDK